MSKQTSNTEDSDVSLAEKRTGVAKFRTQIALDRTTLAWIRTTITMAMLVAVLGLAGLWFSLAN